MELEEIIELIQKLKTGLSAPKVTKTFLEISGYPHYENVISNILAFLFTDSEEHGLTDLWLRSLLLCTKSYVDEGGLQDSVVEREISTREGNRIDLYITTAEYVICIENKIFANLYNDLNEYWKYVKEKNHNDKKEVFILLCIDKRGLEEELIRRSVKDFEVVTYRELFDQVNKLLGEYYIDANDKWLLYIRELIITVSRLSEENTTTMKDEYLKLYTKENYGELIRINRECCEHFEKAVKPVQENLEALLTTRKYNHEPVKIYSPQKELFRDVYVDMLLKDSMNRLSIETRCIFWGWEISLLCRTSSDAILVKNFVNDNFELHEVDIDTWDDCHIIVQRLPLKSDSNVVAEEIMNVIEKLVSGGLVIGV